MADGISDKSTRYSPYKVYMGCIPYMEYHDLDGPMEYNMGFSPIL